jgi:hypothetical protein
LSLTLTNNLFYFVGQYVPPLLEPPHLPSASITTVLLAAKFNIVTNLNQKPLLFCRPVCPTPLGATSSAFSSSNSSALGSKVQESKTKVRLYRYITIISIIKFFHWGYPIP